MIFEALIRIISKSKAKNKPCVLPGVVQKKTQQKFQTKLYILTYIKKNLKTCAVRNLVKKGSHLHFWWECCLLRPCRKQYGMSLK